MFDLKKIFYPLALVYGSISAIRNRLYDKGVFKSFEFDLPIICVGNLSFGGTGKTPHIEYLIRILSAAEFSIATLSRGYCRRTQGFLLADTQTDAMKIGDEPMQLYTKFGQQATVAVGENRAFAIPSILAKNEEIQVILMDDGFQHRPIKAGLNILLTDYHNRYTQDHIAPIGRLREGRSGAKRADIIIVSKCPDGLSASEKNTIRQEIKPLPHQIVCYSHLKYQAPYPIQRLMANFANATNTATDLGLTPSLSVLLLCGIAKTKTIEGYLKERVQQVDTQYYSDHHYFTPNDLHDIQAKFAAMDSSNKVIITTEKDAMRLLLHADWLQQQALPIYCLPVEVYFQAEEAALLQSKILPFLHQN